MGDIDSREGMVCREGRDIVKPYSESARYRHRVRQVCAGKGIIKQIKKQGGYPRGRIFNLGSGGLKPDVRSPQPGA